MFAATNDPQRQRRRNRRYDALRAIAADSPPDLSARKAHSGLDLHLRRNRLRPSRDWWGHAQQLNALRQTPRKEDKLEVLEPRPHPEPPEPQQQKVKPVRGIYLMPQIPSRHYDMRGAGGRAKMKQDNDDIKMATHIHHPSP